MNSSDTVDLVKYWNFEYDSTSPTNVIDVVGVDIGGQANGTYMNTSACNYSSDGKIGGSLRCIGETGTPINATQDNFNFTNLFSGENELSACLWANVTQFYAASNNFAFFSIGHNTGDQLFQFFERDNAADWNPEVYWESGAGRYRQAATATINGQTNSWQYFCFTYNGSYNTAGAVKIYINGSEVAVTDAQKNAVGYMSSTNNFVIGGHAYAADNAFRGHIDELALWNRTLTAEEIASFYADEKVYATAEADNSPEVTLSQPDDETVQLYTDPALFECNLTDDNGLVNVTHYIWNYDNSVNITNATTISGTTNSTTFSYSLGIGNFIWNCLAFDDAGQSSWATANYTINISDKYVPELNLTLGGTQGNKSIYTGNSTDLNCSTVTGDSGAYLELWNDGTLINNGTSPIGNTTEFATEGEYNITCVYEETANYSRSSSTYYLTVSNYTDINPIWDNIIFYLAIDEGSGTDIADSIGNITDATTENSPAWVLRNGDNALNFSYLSKQTINFSNTLVEPNINGSNPFTFGAWVCQNHTGDYWGLMNYGYDADHQVGIEVVNDQVRLMLRGATGTTSITTVLGYGNLTTECQYVVVSYGGNMGGSDTDIYINGTNYGDTVAYSSYSGFAHIDNEIEIGHYYYAGTSGGFFTGIIDEVAFWGRALNSTEVTTLWNGGDVLTYGDTPPVDSTPPTFTDIYNISKDLTQSVNEDFNATDETGFSCWSVNDTDFSIDCTGQLTNASEITEGFRYINLTINDTSNNQDSIVITVNYTDTTDTTHPYFTSITNQTLNNITELSYDIDADDETSFDSFSIDDTTNFSIVASTGVLTNATQLAVGYYELNVTINDSSNNLNSTLLGINVTGYTPGNFIPTWIALHFAHDNRNNADAPWSSVVTWMENLFDAGASVAVIGGGWTSEAEWDSFRNDTLNYTGTNENFTMSFGAERVVGSDEHVFMIFPDDAGEDLPSYGDDVTLDVVVDYIKNYSGVGAIAHPTYVDKNDFTNHSQGYNDTYITFISMYNYYINRPVGTRFWDTKWECAEDSGCSNWTNSKPSTSTDDKDWVRVALDEGWHFGFYAEADVHDATYNETQGGFTGMVSVENNSKQAIIDTIKARHIWAGEQKMFISFNASDGVNTSILMGDIINTSVTNNITFNYYVEGWSTYNVTNISLIYNGVIINHTNYDGSENSKSGEITVQINGTDETYTYLQFEQSNGFYAYSSPIWITFGNDLFPPTFTDIENQTIDNATALYYDINVTDETLFDSCVVDDTGNFTIDASTCVIQNATQLAVGYYEVNVTANDSSDNLASEIWGLNVTEAGLSTISISAIYPTGDINVTQNEFFNVTLNVTCVTGSCGTINVSLDPELISEGGSDEWLMFGRNLNNTRWDGITFTKYNVNNVTFDLTNDVHSSPAVANGYVYIGGFDGKLYQLNASDISQEINSYSTGLPILSSPAVANGYVYIGGYDSKVHQLNATNVSIQIAEFTAGSTFNSGSPAISNDYLYIGGNDDVLYQLNASDISQQIANYTTGDGIIPSPTIANGFVYIGSDDHILYQLNATDVSQQIANFTTTGELSSSPAIYNGYLYFGDEGGVFYQLNASEISQQIANLTIGSPIQTSPAVDSDYVYTGSLFGGFYQLNASDISQIINNYNFSTNISYSSPAIYEGSVFFGAYDNNLYQLNATNVSQYLANYTTGGVIWSSPAVANGYVYVGSYDDNIYQFLITNFAKNGLISTIEGNTPFYTNASNNPQTTSSLSEGESELVTFWVNATGNVGTTHVFFAYANTTTDLSVSSITNEWNVTIVSAEVSDTTPPYFTDIDNQTIYDNQSLSYDINATDETLFDSCSIDDTTNFSIDSDCIITNASAMVIGTYEVNITANDSSNNLNSTLWLLTVLNSTQEEGDGGDGGGGGGGGASLTSNYVDDLVLEYKTWKKGILNSIETTTYNQDDELIDASMTFDIIENVDFTQNVVRISEGKYKATFMINDDVESVTLKVKASEGGKTVEKTELIELEDPNIADKIAQAVRDKAGSLESLVQDRNIWFILFGGIFTIIAIAVVIIIARK